MQKPGSPVEQMGLEQWLWYTCASLDCRVRGDSGSRPVYCPFPPPAPRMMPGSHALLNWVGLRTHNLVFGALVLLKDRLAPFHLKEQRVLLCKWFTSLLKDSQSGWPFVYVQVQYQAPSWCQWRLLLELCVFLAGKGSWVGGADLGPSLEPCDSRGSSWGTCPVLGESACEMFLSCRLHAASRHSCATNDGQLCRLLWKDTETEGQSQLPLPSRL